MQTHFSPAQLADPQVAETDRILRACVHCGFCTATCPTYLLTGDELDGPRGRIYLAKDMLEKNRPADPTTVKHLDRCLTCLACMTTCPSGVHYMHLVDHARQHIERTYRRPLGDRLLRSLLAFVLPHTGRFRAALRIAALMRPFRTLLPRRLRSLIDSASSARSSPANESIPSSTPQSRQLSVRRVALLPGCVQPALRPEINEATIRLLNRLGIEVIIARDAGCCGALVHHLGREHDSTAQAKANIDIWTRELESKDLDAIIVTASGCGTMLKDYGFLFRNDPDYAAKAKRIASLARDVSELLAEVMPARSDFRSGLRVAHHSACSLQHGQRLHTLAPELLTRAGFTVLDIPESHLCCGSAGTYSLLQPEFSTQLRDRKARNIESVTPDVIATGNIGCITQIAQATRIPIVHTVELLDWSAGGPPPQRLLGGMDSQRRQTRLS
jgi:glycolate oxidase iron-sulfur subunit